MNAIIKSYPNADKENIYISEMFKPNEGWIKLPCSVTCNRMNIEKAKKEGATHLNIKIYSFNSVLYPDFSINELLNN
jgi:hypothetical protein